MPSLDFGQLEKQLIKRAKIERRAGPKPVRLSNLFAQTAWLGGELLWHEDRVIFRVGDKIIRLETDDIQRTSRALERLAKREVRRELADLIAERRKRFEYLREIATLEAPDLKILCSVSRRQNPKAIERLGALLVVESLAPQLLDHSPTRALALAWPLSANLLESLAKSEAYPPQTRELARFALANRHVDFWQQHVDFPVVLGAKFGYAGHELPEIIEQVGPYSLSASEIYELYQGGLPIAQVRDVALTIRDIRSVWPDFLARDPFGPKELLQARAHYKSFEKSSREEIRQTLLHLARSSPRSAVLGAEFLSFWLGHWYGLLFETTKKRPRRCVSLVFNAVHSVLRKVESRHDAGGILSFLLEKSAEDAGNIKSITATCDYLSEDLSFSCDLACAIGVGKARDIAASNRHLLNDLIAQPQWLELMMEWRAICDGTASFYWELSIAQRKGIAISGLRSFGREVEKEVRRFPPEFRGGIFERALSEIEDRYYLRLLAALYKKYSLRILTFHPENYSPWTLVLSIVARVSSRQKWPLEKALRVSEITFETLKGHFDWSKRVEELCEVALRHILGILPAESQRDFEQFRIVLGKAFEWSKSGIAYDILCNVDRDSADAIASRIHLRRAFLATIHRSPRFVFDTLTQLKSLKRLHLMDAFDAFEARTPLQGEAWYRFLARYPALEPEIRDCFLWRRLAGEAPESPPISNRWRDYETKTPREMEFLRAKILEQPNNLGLQKRLATLETQWRTRDVWLKKELRESLVDAASHSAKIAIQNSISAALRQRLRVVCGELPPDLELNNDWINAILLACEVEENRKWAVAILRHCARALVDPAAADWRAKLAGNAEFLAEMRLQKKNIEFYDARNERQIGEFTLWIESDPLQILQMGNRFDTCLSRGGCNEHSAITNAIDSNKKIVYARHFSSIVGRQLLCVSDQFALLGYEVYSTLPSQSKERYALNRAFDEFASYFAAGVGLEKADEGEVKPLCSASWYDDGEIEWASLRVEPPSPDKKHRSRSKPENEG